MKKDLTFISILFLGISLLISSLIISKSLSISEPTIMNGSLNGSLTLNDTNSYKNSDVLQVYDAAAMLGYNDYNVLIQDINNGKLKGIPYTVIGNHYMFSKKALEEWIYNMSIK